jgi:hypothetical protein
LSQEAAVGTGRIRRREKSRGLGERERGATGEEGLWEEKDGVRVSVGCSVIYQGNTRRTMGLTIDGRK